MASSTTMPMARTSPNSESVLNEMPTALMTANVPTSETGIARMGIPAARQVCRNRITTSTTGIIASHSVSTTASIENWMNSVGL
jgi:hypothetical protein